jgi:hypothetical protein
MPFVLAALAVSPAATAQAETYCVGVARAGCAERSTAAAAFEAARADADLDTILLGRLAEAASFADAPGRPVRVAGAGAQATVLRAGPSGPTLRLGDRGSSVSGVRLEAGAGAALQLDAGGRVRTSVVAGRVWLRGGEAALESVVVAADGPALDAGCEQASSSLDARHVTVAGAGDPGVRAECGVAGRTATVHVADSIVWGFARAFATGARGAVGTRSSDYPGAAGPGDLSVDPGFAGAGDLRLRPGSPLVDAGRAGPLDADEPHEDALGFLRAADGDGDGAARRDMGALELQPAPPSIAGNVLVNGGAEAGDPASDDRASPPPPAWTRTGGFTSVRYGTLVGDVPFPSRRLAEALDGGEAFFAGGPRGQASATQVADLTPWAPEIDLGEAGATLSAMLGGYRASGDGAIVDARFRGPAGGSLASVRIGPVTAEQRANATALTHRAATVAIPPLARSVAVTMRTTPPAGSYDDAYFDRVALVPLLAGAPAPDPPEVAARPYAGVAVLSPRAGIGPHRRHAWVRLGCPSATVGACRGAVTLTARGRAAGRRRFALRPGRARRVRVALSRSAVRGVRRARLYAASRDAQGLTRTSTSPLRLVRLRPAARPRGAAMASIAAAYGVVRRPDLAAAAYAAGVPTESHSAGSVPAGVRPG